MPRNWETYCKMMDPDEDYIPPVCNQFGIFDSDDPRAEAVEGCEDCGLCSGEVSAFNAIAGEVNRMYGGSVGLRANLRNLSPAEARVAVTGLVEVNKLQIRRRRQAARRASDLSGVLFRCPDSPMDVVQANLIAGGSVGSIVKDAFSIFFPHGGKHAFQPKKAAAADAARKEEEKKAAAQRALQPPPVVTPTVQPMFQAPPRVVYQAPFPTYQQQPMYQQPPQPAQPPRWAHHAMPFARDVAEHFRTDYDEVTGAPRDSMIQAIYDGAVVYDRDDRGEHWQSFDELMASGAGDCEDLAAAVAAEMQLDGMPAFVGIDKSGKNLWHATVKVIQNDGAVTTLDPSRWAGMGQ